MTRATNPLPMWMSVGFMTVALAAGSAAYGQAMPMDRDPPPKSETEGQAPPGSGNPSDQLDRQQGVIRPPSVDPDMQVSPPPGSQKTPVIPPPGTPGGDQTIQPK